MRNQEDFMNKKWKVAVVGAGNFSGAYFDNIEQCADAKCVAVCDQDRQRREAAQRRYNLPEAYASVSELLEKCDFDIAIDAASIPAHHEINMALLDAGKHLITQKPAAVTVEEVTEQIELARRCGVKFACVPVHSLAPRMKLARELIRNGAIGQLVSAKCVSAHGGPEYFQNRQADPQWFFEPGSGALYDMGIHAVDKIVTIMGPAKRVSAMGAIALKHRVVRSGAFDGKVLQSDKLPDTWFVTLDFGNDRLGCIDTGYTHVATRCPQMEIYGSHGTITLDASRATPELYLDSPSLGVRGWIELQAVEVSPKNSSDCSCLTDLVRAIETDTEPELSGVRARHIVEILNAIDESAATGRIVELKTTF